MRRMVILLLPLTLLLGGCWDKSEVQDLAVVLAVGIDYDEAAPAEERVRIAAEIAEVTATVSDGNDRIFYVGGTNIKDALRQMSRQLNRQLFWGHLQVLIISEKAAEQGITPIVESFFNDQQINPLVYVIVAEDDIKKVMEADIGLSPYLGLGVVQLLNHGSRSIEAVTDKVSVQNYMESQLAERTGTLLPTIALCPSEVAVLAAGESADKSMQQARQVDEVELSGFAVTDDEGRLVAVLDDIYTDDVLLWRNKGVGMVVQLGEDLYSVTDWHLQRKMDTKGEVPQLKLQVEAVLRPTDTETSPQPQQLEELSRQAEEYFTMRLQRLWDLAKELDNDFLYVNAQLERKDYRLWRQLIEDEVGWKQIQLICNVDCRIKFKEQ